MIIEKLTLKNFISHKYTTITFNKGVTVLIGPNGAGKSAVLDAISFALFKEHSRGKGLDNLIRRGTSRAEVELQFLVNNKRYLIRRSITKIGKSPRSEAYLYILDGSSRRLIARGDRTVNEEMAKILGIDKDIFLNAIYVRQGEIDKLIIAKPAERKQLIAKLLGLEDLEKAWQNMKEIMHEYDEKLFHLELKIKMKNEIIKRKNELKEEISKLLKEINELEIKKKKIEKELNELNQKLNELELKKKKYEILILEREKIKNELELKENQLKERKRELKEIEELKKKADELSKDVQLLEDVEKAIDLLSELESLRTTLSSYSETYNELKKALDITSSKVKKYNEYLRLTREREELLKTIERIKSLNTQIKEKENELNALKSELNNISKEIESEIKKLSSILNLTPDILVRKYKEITQQLREEIDKIEKEITTLQLEVGGLDNELKSINEIIFKLRTIKNKCPLCESHITPQRRLELIKKHEERYIKKLSELNQKRKEIMKKKEILEVLKSKLNILNSTNFGIVLQKLRYKNELISKIEKLEKDLTCLKEQQKSLNKATTPEPTVKLQQIELSLKTLEKEYREYIASLEILNKYKEKGLTLDKLSEKITTLRETENKLLKELTKVRDKINTTDKNELLKLRDFLRRKKTEYDRLTAIISRDSEIKQEINKLEREICKLKEKLNEIEEKLKQLNYNEEIHRATKEKIEEINKTLTQTITQLSALFSKKKVLENEIERYEKELEDIKKAEAEYNKLLKFMNLLKNIRKAFSKDGVQKMLRTISLPLIEKYTRDFFLMFGLDYSDLKINEDYEITLISNSGEHHIEAISGGERTALALALRLGLAKAIAGGALDFMMLDEPTVNMDESRRRELVEILRKVARMTGVLPQLLIVTHDREIEDAADIIYMVKKENGVSQVVLPKELI